MKKQKSILMMVVLSFLVTAYSLAQELDNLKEGILIPPDPLVRIGRLKNGFTYYIRKNDVPDNKIELRFIVKAGRFFEDKDQLELAHLTEHLAFEGTKHFPKDSMRNYTAKQGLHFGNEFTASTGGMETMYKLTLPVDNPVLLKNSLQILRDWAQDFTFDAECIEAQRGAVLGEYRMANENYFAKMLGEKEYRVINNPYVGTAYADKCKENIRSFKNESLLRFYKDWYRPDLEAAIIVGNIDVEVIEERVRSLFSDMEHPAHVRKMKDFSKSRAGKLREKNQLITITNAEIPQIDLEIYHKQRANSSVKKTVKDYRLSVMDDLYNILILPRFEVLAGRYNLPFMGSRIDRNMYTSGIDWLMTSTRLSDGNGVPGALQGIMIELERLNQHGFFDKELTKAKEDYMTARKVRYSTSSATLANSYIDHFVSGSAIPSPAYEWELITQLVNGISLVEMNKHVKDWIHTDKNIDVVIMAPEKIKSKLPDEPTVMKWLTEIKGTKLEPYKEPDPVPDSLLYTKDITPLGRGMAFMEKWTQDSTVIILHLVNGPKIVLRPSDNENPNEISLMGVSDGGSSLYDGLDYFTAKYASGIISRSGVGKLDKFQLDRYLKNKQVSVYPYVDDVSEQINGSCSPETIETMFQLVYLYFTSPRKDEAALAQWKSNEKIKIENARVDVNRIFESAMEVTGEESSLTEELLERIRMEDVDRIYRERFSASEDFTFFITGDFDYKKTLPLIFKYLGNLPPGEKKEIPVEKKDKVYVPTGKVSKTVYAGMNDKAVVSLYFPTTENYKGTMKNTLKLQVLKEILGFMIFERLRTKEGGAYAPTVSLGLKRVSKDSVGYQFIIQFDCEQIKTENMIGYALEEFRALTAKGPDATLFAKAVEEMRRQLQIQLEYGISARQLKEMYINGESPKDYFAQEKVLDSITLIDIKTAAKEYLTEDNFQQFVLLPESSKTINK